MFDPSHCHLERQAERMVKWIVAEHKDRLTRFGYNYLSTLIFNARSDMGVYQLRQAVEMTTTTNNVNLENR